jgi:Ni2+-binding GTPase involved in maturation of urease and hydrogenase
MSEFLGVAFMNYKMIFIEGLPGTGKTTLSEKIFETFTKQGVQVELLQEGDKIPSNFDNIAGIPKTVFVDFQNDINVITKTENYVFADLKNCREEVANQLRCYDIGDVFNPNVSAHEYARCTLEWWQYWVNDNIKEAVLIFRQRIYAMPY